MSRAFLLRFATMADADTVLAASNYASLVAADEEQQTLDVAIPGTLNGQDATVTEQFNFLASTVKGFTLPHTITRAIPYDVLGLSGSRDIDFTVDDLITFKRQRQNWIGFTVNGNRYYAKDDGGFDLVPESGYEIWDFDGINGWPLMNIKAVYDSEGNQTTAPQRIPGVFVVLRIVGEEQLTADNRADPLDETLWEVSNLANLIKTTGTEKTYTRTAQQTDWGVGYTITYYEKTIGGAVVGMVDPYSLPAEILAQHGIVRTANI